MIQAPTPESTASAAMAKCTIPSASFPRCKGRQIIARFDGGDVTSDGGILLLRQLDREMGLSLAS
ncbi:MAG: transposase [Halomonas sp.]|uniref:hypothetical protein n=1 Tax=Halomonas sp. TaxID=1486246 RepID=UPI001A0FC136|nr:hypothetical protein [Halomonas sp.]MBE0488688.1 transposase [Halomonas sp.]